MITNSLDINKKPSDTRVVVAMSGGVDSSVVAALLKQEGYDVVGITLQLYDSGEFSSKSGTCCAGQDIDDARIVCEKLNIPHYVLDYEKRFYNDVINPFINDYIAGNTPVPCIACNQTVKFKDLLEVAKKLGADALATGHYLKNIKNGEHRALYRAKDASRDQSYFLFATTQKQIDYLRFPLGNIPKSEVRNIAEKLELRVAKKPDSQDICFVANGSYSQLIKNKIKREQTGDIIHLNGTILGTHNGVYNYTIGQRKGLNIAYKEPLYVIMIDAVNSKIIVGEKETLLTISVILKNVNWLGDILPKDITNNGLDIFVKVRSSRPACAAKLFFENDIYKVIFINGEESVAPGQACVFFSDNSEQARLLGGGFIKISQKAPWVEDLLKIRLN